jgi:hypothetical protein
LERRLERIGDDVAQVPRMAAKIHEHGNALQVHRSQLDDVLGPRDSLLLQVGALRGTTDLLESRLTRIEGSIAKISTDTAQILESHEIARATVAGQWQIRAATVTAVVAALTALAVAALQAFR